MEETKAKGQTVILGVGNLLLGDEGVGVHAAVNLRRFPLPGSVSAIEGGTDGFKLFNVITQADRLIVVDCVWGGGEPGSIYRFDAGEVKQCRDRYTTSVHQVSILEVLHLCGLMGKAPRTTVIGVEPASVGMSMELSPIVKDKLVRVMELALEAAGLDTEAYASHLRAPLVQPGPEDASTAPQTRP